MMVGHGWCVLRSSRELYRNATLESVDAIDDLVDAEDESLWTSYRKWMLTHDDGGFIKWHLHEHLNNHCGILLFCVSRNHRSSIWDMLAWIAENGPGSYGLFYVFDDEDSTDIRHDCRGKHDFTNEFRVHRIANGKVTEHADPFLSPLVPTLNPSFLA